MSLIEYASHSSAPASDPDNALFLERLDAFVQKSLADIEAFAERESRSYEETRRYVAEWHVKHLFGPILPVVNLEQEQASEEERLIRVRNALMEASKILESLAGVTGVQSFLLAVDPHNPQDMGFLGGSLIGREFYRGLRGGGESGATFFKAYVYKRIPFLQEGNSPHEPPVQENPPAPLRSARQTKVDLYEAIRSQLRSVSGMRKAEMKWTNPERLNIYGVQLIGWPSDIPAANPSSLKANQNQRLLELVEQGELRFEKTTVAGMEATIQPDAPQGTVDAAAEDFSWAYDAEGGGNMALPGSLATTSAARSLVTASPALSLDPMLSTSTGISPIEGDSLGDVAAWKDDTNELFAAEREGSGGFDGYDFHPDWNDDTSLGEHEAHSPIERRVRKRRRSLGEEE